MSCTVTRLIFLWVCNLMTRVSTGQRTLENKTIQCPESIHIASQLKSSSSRIPKSNISRLVYVHNLVTRQLAHVNPQSTGRLNVHNSVSCQLAHVKAPVNLTTLIESYHRQYQPTRQIILQNSVISSPNSLSIILSSRPPNHV